MLHHVPVLCSDMFRAISGLVLHMWSWLTPVIVASFIWFVLLWDSQLAVEKFPHEFLGDLRSTSVSMHHRQNNIYTGIEMILHMVLITSCGKASHKPNNIIVGVVYCWLYHIYIYMLYIVRYICTILTIYIYIYMCIYKHHIVGLLLAFPYNIDFYTVRLFLLTAVIFAKTWLSAWEMIKIKASTRSCRSLDLKKRRQKQLQGFGFGFYQVLNHIHHRKTMLVSHGVLSSFVIFPRFLWWLQFWIHLTGSASEQNGTDRRKMMCFFLSKYS